MDGGGETFPIRKADVMEASSLVRGLLFGSTASCFAEVGEFAGCCCVVVSCVVGARGFFNTHMLCPIALALFLDCASHTVTMPIDVVKVRLQMQGADGTRQYRGIVDACVKTARNEGALALWKGLPPALVRQVCC